ncbi:DNA polymerase IV [Candidatus Zixiibacteriota bacterium]|nr:DNA polymerase IV [candidate division Zixibacteria bacterium]
MGGIDRTREWEKVIAHVDMDAFFAAFEIRNAPHLKGKPVIVGGDPRHRSVVTTCSYEARKFGVKSAMPMAQALRLCPQAIVISGNLSGYVYTASVLMEIFEHYSPIVEPFSVDEAFLDITGCHKIYGSVENLVKTMKEEIHQKLALTCSVGIAPCKWLAKMTSGENKPDGLTIVDRDDFKTMFYSRPVNALWGVGEATQEAMNKIGIITVGELAQKDLKELKRYFGKGGEYLYNICRGIDPSEVCSFEDRPLDKSMSHETTLSADLSDIDKIYSTILWLSDKVARRLRQDNYQGRTVSVKIRSSDFKTITRDKTLVLPTDQGKVIFETARKLIPRDYGPRLRVRLLGVRVSNLEKNKIDSQLPLLDDREKDKLQKSNQAVDKIRDRFGESAIKLAGTQI